MLLGLRRWLRLLLAGTVGAAPTALAAAFAGPVSDLPGDRFTVAVLRLAVATWWVVALWWAALTVAVLVEVLRGRTLRGHGRPRLFPGGGRRLLLTICGAGLVAGGLAPAHARGGPDTAGLPSPERPIGLATRTGHTHLVRPGDSLWRIAAAQCPRATPARIAALTRTLYRLNRDVVGADPDLLHPGTRLRLPLPVHTKPKEMR